MILKLIIITLMTTGVYSCALSQTFNEWFFQNKTELKYLGKQIAALEAYEKVVAKGYSIVKTGTNVIGNIKRGDLSLHADYFNSLKAVKPAVRDLINTVKAEWLKMQIKRVAELAENDATSSGVYSQNELKTIRDVFDGILSSSGDTWNAFQAVLTNGALEMNDAGRITRSEILIRTLAEQYNTALTFSRAVTGILQSRLHELFDVETGKNLLGNK